MICVKDKIFGVRTVHLQLTGWKLTPEAQKGFATCCLKLLHINRKASEKGKKNDQKVWNSFCMRIPLDRLGFVSLEKRWPQGYGKRLTAF